MRLKPFNPDKELKKANRKYKKQLITTLLVLVVIITIGSSYAIFSIQPEYHTFVKSQVGEFSTGDIKLSVLVEGVAQSDFPAKDTGYAFEKVECENGSTGTWDANAWQLTLASKWPDKCTVSFVKKPEIIYDLVEGNVNSNGWSNNNLKLIAKVENIDSSSISEIKSCQINSTADCDPIDIKSLDDLTFLISSEGNNKDCLGIVDTNQNSFVECSNIYKIDKTLPVAGNATFNGTLGNNGWYRSAVSVNVSNGSDLLSGHLYTSTNVTTINSNTAGSEVIVTTSDVAGNLATKSYTVKIDTTLPVINNINHSATGNSITFTVDASDSYSGISQYCYKINTQPNYVCQSSNSYTFSGLSSSTLYNFNIYTIDNAGNQSTVYARSAEIQAGGSTMCIKAETNIFVGLNGEMKKAKDIEVGDEILTFNSLTGQFELQKVFFINKNLEENKVIKSLKFSDGSSVEIFAFHRFFNVERNYYANISSNHMDDFLGLNYYKINYDDVYQFSAETLISYETEVYTGYVYDFITENNFNYFANGFITSTVAEFSEPFDFSRENVLMYDMGSYYNDVNVYGLITYDEFVKEFGYIPKEVFYALKVERVRIGIGKGYISENDMKEAIELFK